MRATTAVNTWSAERDNRITCDWNSMSAQIMNQWKQITYTDLEATNRDRSRIAQLIERKYGVYSELTENYLRNLERTLPMFQ